MHELQSTTTTRGQESRCLSTSVLLLASRIQQNSHACTNVGKLCQRWNVYQLVRHVNYMFSPRLQIHTCSTWNYIDKKKLAVFSHYQVASMKLRTYSGFSGHSSPSFIKNLKHPKATRSRQLTVKPDRHSTGRLVKEGSVDGRNTWW